MQGIGDKEIFKKSGKKNQFLQFCSSWSGEHTGQKSSKQMFWVVTEANGKTGGC